MTIPLIALLIVYCLGVSIFLLWALFNFYHIIKFGFFDFTGKLNTIFFLGVTAVILFFTILFLKGTPWFDPLFTLSPDIVSTSSIDNTL